MGYTIVFETKIVKLSDGRLLHLDLSGCNNDNSGRTRDDFCGKIYTIDEFIRHAEHFKNKKGDSNGWELKIGNNICTYYDYGQHLLRMMKRATSWDKLKENRCCYGIVFDGVEVCEDGKETIFSSEEWERVAYDFIYGCDKEVTYEAITHFIYDEHEIIQALESKKSVRFNIGRKNR